MTIKMIIKIQTTKHHDGKRNWVSSLIKKVWYKFLLKCKDDKLIIIIYHRGHF